MLNSLHRQFELIKSRTRVLLGVPSFFVLLTLKLIGLTSNEESKPLKSFYLTSDASTCENLKVSN